MLSPNQRTEHLEEVERRRAVFAQACHDFEAACRQYEAVHMDDQKESLGVAEWEKAKQAALYNKMRMHFRRVREALRLRRALNACLKVGIDPHQQADDQLSALLDSLELGDATA